jgi:hypothetical protein
MGYEAALDKAWTALASAGVERERVRFFSDEFRVDVLGRTVIAPSGQPAKDFFSILILHYLERKVKGLPALHGAWISFKELESGEQYYPAFRKRSLDLLLKKYGAKPEEMLGCLRRLPYSKQAGVGDVSVQVDAFEGVPMVAVLWRGDDEFAAEANLLFDRSISGIFCTEDVAVLAGFCLKYI